jgi:hypothetical protein
MIYVSYDIQNNQEVKHIKINVSINSIFIELLILLFIDTNTKQFKINLHICIMSVLQYILKMATLFIDELTKIILDPDFFLSQNYSINEITLFFKSILPKTNRLNDTDEILFFALNHHVYYTTKTVFPKISYQHFLNGN